MSGETDSDQSSWTPDLLKVYLQQQLDDFRTLLDERAAAQTQAIAAALLSAEKAVTKAENATEKRFDSVNEFRAQLADQASQFMPREVAETQTAEFRNQIAAITTRLDLQDGAAANAHRSLTFAIALVGLFVSIVVVITKFIA